MLADSKHVRRSKDQVSTQANGVSILLDHPQESKHELASPLRALSPFPVHFFSHDLEIALVRVDCCQRLRAVK